MSRKTTKEKIGIFFITLGVLGGLYGLFLALTHDAVAATSHEDNPLRRQASLDQIEFEKEELEEALKANRHTAQDLERQLKEECKKTEALNRAIQADTDSMVRLVGYVDQAETGADGLGIFLRLVQERLEQDGKLLIPGGIALEKGILTIAALYQALLPDRYYSV